VPNVVTPFDGRWGRATARVMATMNRDMERAAVEILDPAPSADVLTVGFGPGVGVEELVRRLSRGRVAGVDPSTVMVTHACRRNQDAIAAGQVTLRQAGAESIPWPDASFDGVVAVNSAQLWDPVAVGLGEVARVLRPGGSAVVLTHRWAIERAQPTDRWIAVVTDVLAHHGIVTTVSTRRFRSGQGIIIAGSARE